MIRSFSGYEVGALLYCPANAHVSIVDAIVSEKLPHPFSLAFCLEDTVREDAVEEAEQQLYQTLSAISTAHRKQSFYLPLIFIRVRSPQHLRKLMETYAVFSDILTGFILPKFFIENCEDYTALIRQAKENPDCTYLFMPIFESASMIDLNTRYQNLAFVKDTLRSVSDRILNIRVGGNDLSHAFGLRRRAEHTIYDVKPVADLLVDIATTFATDYVVSGAVWEYYSGSGWDSGLRRELDLDLISGFIGKTVIHPDQIPVINEALRVNRSDYDDACAILNWDPADVHLVSSNPTATRMNEYKTHHRWAQKILHLANIYGIKP